MIRITLTLLFLTVTSACFSQATSQLVYSGGNGKLEYALYANRGQTEQVNKVPDFSWAGYKKGGVSLPVVPVVLTLAPIPGDNRAHIQMAIDQVSAISPDQEGIRGAILLKAGKYDCSGPLTIKASGVIIRGEGQKPAGSGGTQLHATATTQHTLITFSGIQPSAAASVFVLDTIVVPQRKTGDFNGDGIPETIDGKTWLSASVTEAAAVESEGDQILSLRLAANNGEYVAYDSRENNNKPYLSLRYRMAVTGRDSLISLFPTDDVYVRGGEYATQNYGTDNSLVIKNEGAGSSVTREFYLKFTLPSIDADLTDASLFLYCNNAGDNGNQLNFVSAIPNDQWTEMTVNYQNQPFSPSQNTRIISPYLATGSNSFTVEKADGYKAGDLIAVLRTPNQTWIDDLQMAQYGWTASAYKVAYERRITAVKGDTITVDAPLVQAIEHKYGGGEIYKLDNSGRSRNCGIENLYITSHYAFDEDENHGWTAVSFSHTEDCWARNVTAQYFGYGCIGLRGVMNTTVQDCAMLDPKSITTGSRKYSFYIDKGSFNLFQRCYTRGGRHDYVTGSQVAGPNVFLDCLAEQTHADIGPHHRYATGLLFDNIKGGQTRVQNRKDSGTGHGWAGAQTMFWNLEVTGSDIKVESPVGAMNWGIGCIAPTKYGDGYWDNWGTHVVPRSLYLKQLEDRLGRQAVENITISQQREKPIWDILTDWKGIGQLTTSAQTEVSSGPVFKLYPNPTSGSITVETSTNNNGKTWFIYSAAGRLEKSGVFEANPCQVNLTGLPSGLYFFKVENEARGIRFIRK